MGNYYFVTGNNEKAREVFQKVTAGGGWNAFGFIAAESDLARRIERLYSLVYGRAPSAAEHKLAREYLTATAAPKAWESYA